MKDELVSIIMPSLNSEKYIGESIESVINQTYKKWELIVCDDGSADNTLKIANSFKDKEKRISVIKNIHNLYKFLFDIFKFFKKRILK